MLLGVGVVLDCSLKSSHTHTYRERGCVAPSLSWCLCDSTLGFLGFVAQLCAVMSSNMRTKTSGPRPAPSRIEYRGMRFLITDRPTQVTLRAYVEELKRCNAAAVVRVCEPTYETDMLENEGITVTDLRFDDGSFPPKKVIDEWFSLLQQRFGSQGDVCVAVHCVAGLGRAPVLVALALMELGLRYEDAVNLIRENRRGAINAKQLQFLQEYRPKSRLKQNGHKPKCVLQ